MAPVTDEQALEIAARRTALWFWRAVRRLLRVVLHPFFSLKVVGREHLEVPGGAIIAPSHRSQFGAPLVGSLTVNRMRSVAKRSLFKTRVFGWTISALGAYPVDRGTADRNSLATSERMLNEGTQLLLFPYGTRHVGETIGDLFEGMVYLAARTGKPVVLVGIAGTEEALPSGAKRPHRSKVRIVVGEPRYFGVDGPMKRSERKAATLQLHTELQGLYDQALALLPPRR